MKLELKHLVGYLPYGLKSYVEYDGHKLIKDINVNNVMCIVDSEVLSKPILRPLSGFERYFSKLFDEDIDVRTFLNEGFITKENQFEDIADMIDNYKIEWWPHGVIQLALKHHFDIFGLIEQGLAIDINTLNK